LYRCDRDAFYEQFREEWDCVEKMESIKTLVVDFYPEHLRRAIIKLNQNKVINVRYWLIDANGDYAGEPNMHTSNIAEMEREYHASSRQIIEDVIYDRAHQYLYPFINIDNRWTQSTEICTYVHNFNRLFLIWYHIFKQYEIELILMGNAPHGAVPFMAYVVAKALNVKIIMTEQAWFIKNRFMCFRSINLLGCDYLEKKLDFHAEMPQRMGGYQKTPFYMPSVPREILYSGRFRLIPTLQAWFLNGAFVSKLKKHKDDLFYKVIEKLAYRVIDICLNKRFKKHRNDQCMPFDKGKKYVYFPLHLQPEMTTDTLGGVYEDQLLALERLVQLLPEDWIVYVKENPKQTYYKRCPEFFIRLKGIHKAILVEPCVDTYELIKHAQFVATITGTAGWEAITAGKKCLCFGYAWYRSLAGVIQYSSKMKFYDIMQYQFTKEEFERSYERFCKSLFPGIVAGGNFYDLNENFTVEENNTLVYESLKKAVECYDD
jgi:hypothetical protein